MVPFFISETKSLAELAGLASTSGSPSASAS